MCNNCIHKPVCGKFLATGGHVNSCEHHKEERKGEWRPKLDHKGWHECEEYFGPLYECSLCGSEAMGDDNGCGDPYCGGCGADMR